MSQQEMTSGQVSKASSVCAATPYCWHYLLSTASGQISGDIGFSQEWEPTVNCTCKGSRLHAPYKNLMLDDLILYCGELHNYFITYHNVIITEIKYNERNELESS